MIVIIIYRLAIHQQQHTDLTLNFLHWLLVPCFAEPWLMLSSSELVGHVWYLSLGELSEKHTGITHVCWRLASGNLECYFRNYGIWS